MQPHYTAMHVSDDRYATHMPAMVAMQNIMSAMIASMSFEANVAMQCTSDNRYAACKPATVAMCTSDVAMQHVSSERRYAMQTAAMINNQFTERKLIN